MPVLAKFQTQAKHAEEWLRRCYKLGKPTVIQADAAGAYFQFRGDSTLYKSPWNIVGGDAPADPRTLKVR